MRDQQKIGESIKYFQIILDKYPRSRYLADAWMAIAEYRFYEQQNYKSSLEAYEKVLKYPKSTLYDLALFKTAWCYWKLGDTTKSAQRFKEVLDLAKKKAGRSDEQQKRAEELQGEALDYLVELFTEDDTKTARDAFEFLAQIGGKQYSRKVLKQLADTVFDQTRYERAVEAYRLLIELDPNASDAPDYAGKIVEGYQLMGDIKTAVAEMRKLAGDYGPHSAWATANRDRPKTVENARTMAEGLIRNLAKTMHAEAQQNEKASKVVDKDRYARAAEAYEFYLANFPDAPDVAELRYLRADILYFKLGKYEDAGREYLAVGKTQPVGKYHKDALLQSMGAFEKVRKPIPSNGSGAGKREITDSDRLFGEAADLYATLFPNDKEIVTVIYKNGQFFFDYGDYDEAVKRFGLIVERYPDDPNAGAAGDKILQALGKAKDYENIESWARRLKKTKAFAPKDEQDCLDKLIVGAVMKSGEKYAASGDYDKAAAFFLRVPHEYPANGNAPKALNNAAAVYEKEKKQDEAVAAYKELADKYPSAGEAPDALFTAARIEENIAYYDKAAGLYEQLAAKYPQSSHAADALRSAGVLRQSLGQHDRAIKHYGDYAKRYKDRPDAKDVAFQAAVVREDQKDWRAAAASFAAFSKVYPGDTKTVEALAREADAHLKAGNDAAAKETSAKALAAYGKHGKGFRRGKLLRRRGPLHPGRAGLPRLREDQDRRQTEAAGQGARGEGQATRGGEVDLPRRRHLQVARVGDGLVAAHRPGVRSLRQGDAQRAGAEGPQGRRKADVPRRAGEGHRRDRGQGDRRLQVGLCPRAADRRLQQAHAGDPPGARAPGRKRVPQGGRDAPLHPARRAAGDARPDRGGAT